MPKQCPVCEAQGKNSIVRLIQININDALVNCEDPECCYPFGTSYSRPLLRKRNYRRLAREQISQVRSEPAINTAGSCDSDGIANDVSIELDKLLEDKNSAQLGDNGFSYDDYLTFMDEDNLTQEKGSRIDCSVQNQEPVIPLPIIDDSCTVYKLKSATDNLNCKSLPIIPSELSANNESDFRIVPVDEISELNQTPFSRPPLENVVSIKCLNINIETIDKPVMDSSSTNTGNFLQYRIYNAHKLISESAANDAVKSETLSGSSVQNKNVIPVKPSSPRSKEYKAMKRSTSKFKF